MHFIDVKNWGSEKMSSLLNVFYREINSEIDVNKKPDINKKTKLALVASLSIQSYI